MNSDEILFKIGHSEQIIELATSPARALILLSNLQLSLRHPSNDGESRAIARDIAANLENAICHHIPEARELIQKGWHPEFDCTREEFEDGDSGVRIGRDRSE